MRVLFSSPIPDCRVISFSSLMPRPAPCVHPSFPLCLHFPMKIKPQAWAGSELGPDFSRPLVCEMGEEYSRHPEGTGFQILMSIFPKSSVCKSKLGNGELWGEKWIGTTWTWGRKGQMWFCRRGGRVSVPGGGIVRWGEVGCVILLFPWAVFNRWAVTTDKSDRLCAAEWSDNTSRPEGILIFLVLLLMRGRLRRIPPKAQDLVSAKLKAVTEGLPPASEGFVYCW